MPDPCGADIFSLSMIRGLPKSADFNYEGVQYLIETSREGPPAYADPMRYDGNTFVNVSFNAGDGVQLQVVGRPAFRTKTNWGNSATPYEEVPQEQLVVEIWLDKYAAVQKVIVLGQILDERLRLRTYGARQALIAYGLHVAQERQERAARAEAARQARVRADQKQVEERLQHL